MMTAPGHPSSRRSTRTKAPVDSVAPYRREQLMLDQMVQGTLIRRVVYHWFLCLFSTAVAGWVWTVWTDPEANSPLDTLQQLWPAFVGSLFLLPLAIADMLRTSNRFVGPVLRLRNAMKCLVMGDWVDPLRPRQGDFWGDLIERFNQVQRQVSDRSER